MGDAATLVADIPDSARLTGVSRALVTGGGGFLGFAIVSMLRAQGVAVRSFARGSYTELDEIGAEQLRGDLCDADAVCRAADGCDLVLHVAAKPGFWGRYQDYYGPNVEGTEHVLQACRAAGIQRLVYTSSPSVVFDGSHAQGIDERYPYPKRFGSVYSETKALAEQRVLAANGRDLKTIALRPHLVWGPRDNHIVPRLIARAKAGRLRQVGDGANRIDATYIDNAALAHLCAARALDENPSAAGRAYFIGNDEPIEAWTLINKLLEVGGAPLVTKQISHRAARRIGRVMEWLYGGLRLPGEPPMTRFVADELAKSHWFDLSAARNELGYAPIVSTAEGLERLRAWLIARH